MFLHGLYGILLPVQCTALNNVEPFHCTLQFHLTYTHWSLFVLGPTLRFYTAISPFMWASTKAKPWPIALASRSLNNVPATLHLSLCCCARMAIYSRGLSPNDNMELIFGVLATMIDLIMVFLKLKCWKRWSRRLKRAKLQNESPSLPLHSTTAPRPRNAPFTGYPPFGPSFRAEPNMSDATPDSRHVLSFQDQEELWMTESRRARSFSVGRCRFHR